MRGWWMVLLWVAAPAVAGAQGDVLVAVDGASDRGWRARVEGSLDEPVDLGEWARRRQPAGTVDPAALDVLERIQALLVEAKAASARLRERDALRTLTEAEALAEGSLEVPGMAAWYAEVQLAIAVIAAQAGMEGLSEAALGRAASVDPDRGVQAAEARPEVVERGRAAARAVATAPRGRFEVRAEVPDATVALDDRPLGALPRVVEAPVGPHVLRVDAPGHRGWARVITVFEGDRPPVHVALSPTPLSRRAAEVEAAARRGDRDAVVAGLSAIAGLIGRAPRVWMLWPGEGSRDRAVVVGCAASGCGAPQRLEASAIPDRLAVGVGSGVLDAALRWRDAPDDVPPPDVPWWERWYVWAGAGAVIAAGVIAVIVAALPQGPGPIQVQLEWGDGW